MDADISKYKKLYANYAEVSYPITYSESKHKVSDRLSHKRLSKKIAENMEEYVSIFDNRDYLSLDRDTYIYPFEGSVKKCAFCLKSEPDVSFKNKPHVIPEFLGNKYLLHYDECDQCNSEFGNTIVTALQKSYDLDEYHKTIWISHFPSNLGVKTSLEPIFSRWDLSQGYKVVRIEACDHAC